jgi:hypothetical protein
MEDKPMSPVEIVKLPLEVLGGKGISLQSDHASTSFFESASDRCQWHEKDEIWVIECGYNWPFRHWLADKVAVHVRFEYNGCDINNARLTLSSTSFIKWYNDKASFQISATGAASKLRAPSGCTEGCEGSVVVEFDVALAASYDFVQTGNRFWTASIGANGTVEFVER